MDFKKFQQHKDNLEDQLKDLQNHLLEVSSFILNT